MKDARSRQVNIWLTEVEKETCKIAMRLENLQTLGPWIRKSVLDHAKKVIKQNDVQLSEGDTLCAQDTVTKESTASVEESQNG